MIYGLLQHSKKLKPSSMDLALEFTSFNQHHTHKGKKAVYVCMFKLWSAQNATKGLEGSVMLIFILCVPTELLTSFSSN